MNRSKHLLAVSGLAVGFLALVSSARAELVSRTIEYKENGVPLEGYLVYDNAGPAKKPGVLVIHEWNGLNQFARDKANEVAKLGYVAFAPDIYGKGIRPETPDAAGAEAGKYKKNPQLMRARARAGFDVLKSQAQVDPNRIAAIGFCFGGTTALELARSGAPLLGVVSFHGGLGTAHPEDAKNIKAKVLVLNGGDDPNVPPAEVDAFVAEMKKGGVDWQLIDYGGAVHGFTNPSRGTDNSKGVAYNEKAAHRAWSAMKQFFSEIF